MQIVAYGFKVTVNVIVFNVNFILRYIENAIFLQLSLKRCRSPYFHALRNLAQITLSICLFFL